MTTQQETLRTITGAANAVPAPVTWLRAHDAVLQPLRDDNGRRLYSEEHIQRARELRRKRKAA